MNNSYKRIIYKGVSGRMGKLYRGILVSAGKNGKLEDNLTCDQDGQWYVIRPSCSDFAQYLKIKAPDMAIVK